MSFPLAGRLHGRLPPPAPSASRLSFETLEGREVPASGLGVASDYSAFILGDFHGQYSDIQGRLAVGGNATITGYSVGTGLTDSDGTRDDVIVGGNIDYTNGQVFNGNVVYGGTGHFDMFGIPNGTTRQGNVIDFAKARTDLPEHVQRPGPGWRPPGRSRTSGASSP